MKNHHEHLSKTKEVRLNSEYLQKLIAYTNMILSFLDQECKDFADVKEEFLKHSNLLHKEKNRSNYKKEKHKSKKFNDGY